MHLEDSMNNSDNMCHAGGIAVWKDYVYVAGCQDYCVYVYRKSDILSANDGDGVNALGRHMAYVSEKDYLNVDFAEVYGGRLYLGEFYKEEDYPTLEKHHIVTEAGEENHALILGFTLSDEYEYGIPQYPDIGYSIPDMVQGAAFAEGRVYLTTSWGLSDSHLYTYADDLSDEDDLPFQYLRYLDKGARIIELDSGSLISDTILPPMAEEIVPLNGELYIQCESASNKYIFGKFTGGRYCYALDLSSVEP